MTSTTRADTASRENLYRRWRPSRLETMAGQETPRTIISNAARQQRISHAYLFCGPRGTGKTTMARIVAKIANCRRSPELGDACDECVDCRRTAEGHHPDVAEMDAATNRSLDDVRRLQDHTRYLPAIGRRRVVIIDEVHALDHRAVPALLKTLEEPPPHAMFILCTTESDRMPATIVSRCQRHEFARLRPADVYQHLTKVAQAEGITATETEIRAIAQACHGGMRDALNLLEQLSFSDPNGHDRLTAIGIYADDRRALQIIKPMLEGEPGAAIAALNNAVWDGTDINLIKRSGTEILRHALFAVNGQADQYPAHEETRNAIEEALSHPEATRTRVAAATRLWTSAELRHDAPSTLSLELAIMDTCLPTLQTAADPVQARQELAPPIRMPAGNPSQPADPADPPATEPAEKSQADENMPGKWRNTMKSLARTRCGGFWIGPLLRDVDPNLVFRNGDGGLTLPFTNRANLERFNTALAAEGGNTLRQQVAEATSTRDTALTTALATAVQRTPATAPMPSRNTNEAQTSNQERRTPPEPSNVAKAALSLNGRLLRS